jgi:hypothetical protein
MNPYEAFETLDLRVGRILRVEVNANANKPAYKKSEARSQNPGERLRIGLSPGFCILSLVHRPVSFSPFVTLSASEGYAFLAA